MAAAVALADGETWQSRAPLQDTFVHYDQPGAAFGNNTGIIVGNSREGCLMFDVSGLASVDSAKIKFYVTQCSTTAGVTWPLYFRVMRNDTWNEASLTWNSLPDEFRVKPSPVLATNDVALAGYIEVTAGSQDSWCEVDVTEAVKAAAPRGRLALHVYTYKDNNGGDTTPLAFASSDYADATLRPVLQFTGAADASASTLTLQPTADTFILSGNATDNGSSDYVIVDSTGKREGFIKFDLSGIDASSVDSAVLLVRMDEQNDYSSGNNIEFRLTDKTDWGENAVTWANSQSTTGVSPGGAWAAETPANAVRGPSSPASKAYTIELAPLVNRVLAAGGDTLSLNIWRNPSDSRFLIFYSKDYAVEAWRPRLLVTPKVDAALTTRKPVQETFVGTGGKDTAYFPWILENRNPPWDYLQIGCSGSLVQYGLMLFDPAGLDDADFVRLRVKAHNTLPAGNGALRAAAWTTDAWNATNLTWNTTGPWFPQPATVVDGAALDNEIANVRLTQNKAQPYVEFDVTAAVRAAAQAGRMVTFGLFSNNNWPEIWKGSSSYPAVLLFPDPDATFGHRVTASLDESGAMPALRLAWTALPSGQGEYTVERQTGDGSWKTVASGLSEATCIDASAEPWVEHTYRITAYDTADGTSATVVKAVTLEARKTVFACADTYVQNGGYANTSYGTAITLVHKYEYGENSGGVREALYRFDLAEMPENFTSATLKLYPTGNAEGVSGNAHFDLFKYPDLEWSDSSAPTWNTVFANGWATPQAYGNYPDGKRPLETELGSYSVAESGDITANVPVEFDVADAIRTARAAGDTHVTLHTAAYSSGQWNFGIISRERSQGVSCAPQIEFTLRNWVKSGTIIIVR